MTAITPHVSLAAFATRTAAAPLRWKRRRSHGRRGLAAGHRLMAWRSLRKGDTVTASMHTACSQALRGTLREQE